jgi:hypothetical protein
MAYVERPMPRRLKGFSLRRGSFFILIWQRLSVVTAF